ncbi:hypothetical protein FGO68_gene4931 [Halteria grandinella]|uniref:Uncharacterized protein n=1 Tax=Halteria grandinella TaxID=5974 RepID=A0A8J8SYL6_HALGN|nr:hypothetical protein FGO68_gene4931 [Halteria grandinella]
MEELSTSPLVTPLLFKPKALNPKRLDCFEQDINHLLNQTLLKFNPIDPFDELKLWESLKEAWGTLRFSCIHHAICKEESVQEYYQTLYGAILLVVPSRFEQPHVAHVACLMILHIVVNTAPVNQRVRVNMSVATYSRIVTALETLRECKLAIAILKRLPIEQSFQDGLLSIKLEGKGLQPAQYQEGGNQGRELVYQEKEVAKNTQIALGFTTDAQMRQAELRSDLQQNQ